jgi:phosphoglycerate dehydrogenase-like enzyme
MLVWVPLPLVAGGLAGIDGVEVQAVDPDDGAPLPSSAAEVEFYVPPLFPRRAAVDAMDAMGSLRVVQTLTAGIDVLQPRIPGGAVLCNAHGIHDPSTAEWVLAAILASVRELGFFAAEQAAGRWSSKFTGTLAGQHVLIVGYGSIGRAVERRLAGFETTITRVARSARDGVHPVADLPGLLPLADVVIMLAPVTPETKGMVDARFLAAMKDGALLVNGARGTLVVTDDLCAELSTGRLRAALDVTDPEPLPSGHQLWPVPNLLITPHAAAMTGTSAMAVMEFLRAQLQRFVAGEQLANIVTGAY